MRAAAIDSLSAAASSCRLPSTVARSRASSSRTCSSASGSPPAPALAAALRLEATAYRPSALTPEMEAQRFVLSTSTEAPVVLDETCR